MRRDPRLWRRRGRVLRPFNHGDLEGLLRDAVVEADGSLVSRVSALRGDQRELLAGRDLDRRGELGDEAAIEQHTRSVGARPRLERREALEDTETERAHDLHLPLFERDLFLPGLVSIA